MFVKDLEQRTPESEREREHELVFTRQLRDEPKFAAGKIAFFQYVTVVILLFLVAGFWDLQVRQHEENLELSDRNHIKSVPVLAPRGKILDRDGRVIVDNSPAFRLLLSRENLKQEHLAAIAEGLNLDYDDLVARVKRYETRPKYEPIVIKQELTAAELAFVESHRDQTSFPEMEVIQAQRRLYPKNGLAAHAIGYVGEISEPELNSPDFAKYSQGDIIGKAGLERQYNESLMGIDGQRRVMVDNMGRERQVLDLKEATPGKPLQLTLDLDLQVVAELAMENKRGAVVAINPRNGEVLAMVSRPAFDPNVFAGRIRSADWKEIVENPFNPLMNRAIQAQLAPGSTFKPFVAIAALETGSIDPGFHVSCGGGASFYGRFFKCHQRGGHGSVELHKALIQSCDVFFYNAGNRMSIDQIWEYATMAGLGQRTNVDLPHEAEGLIPSSKWKLRTQRQKWYAGETISVAIGQGAVQVSPIQLAHAVGGLAMGGVWFRPHLVKDATTGEPARKANWNPENVQRVLDGLYGVVNEGGTGARARMPNIELCGKTGTAQLASNDLLRAMKAHEVLKDNAWFVGFAPKNNPEIVVAALFESGEHGNLAAPIVRDIVKAYYDKKARMTPPKKEIASVPAAPRQVQP
jgi:penicillin-binding protein 2